jgi:hypothetical protein
VRDVECATHTVDGQAVVVCRMRCDIAMIRSSKRGMLLAHKSTIFPNRFCLKWQRVPSSICELY